MHVTFTQLQEMSGYDRRSDVRRWCDDNGIVYFLNRRGEPVTTQAAVDAALLGSPGTAVSRMLPYEQPNFGTA